MANLQQRIEVEIANISKVIEEIKNIKDKKDKSTVELAGIATFVHNFYNGIENILKQILLEKDVSIPQIESWHKDLLELSMQNKIITKQLRNNLSEYLAFRHFLVHAYVFTLKQRQLLPLVNDIDNVFVEFKENIREYLV